MTANAVQYRPTGCARFASLCAAAAAHLIAVGDRQMRLRALAVGATVVAAAAVLSACETGSTLGRTDAPQVLTGADVPGLVGFAPSTVVGFSYIFVDDVPEWRQIPVQIDERKVVGFGTQPSNNTTPGTVGTVYGSGTSTVTRLQYTDASTWVGPDSNANFDADDELVFMTGDAGGEREAGSADPAGVIAGSGVRVQLTDPTDATKVGSVYLFRSSGALVPSAGKDYVDYDFVLTSGDYKTTYKRRTGPNPETSKVTTDAYEIQYTDRWYETSWKLDGATSTGVDILDGVKNQFGLDFCGRSNATFAAAEGAFVANIDGPVRGIRSYVGANSGPLTQRTHLMYRNQEVVVTDLRVHAIPGVMDYLDLSSAASGMTYRSDVVPAGVLINGVDDAVPTTPANWEAISGAQGSVMINVDYQSSIANFDSKIEWYYEDKVAPTDAQCWGDSSLYGASGPAIVGGIDNTDPEAGAHQTVKGVRTTVFSGAPADPALVDDLATAWSAQLAAPPTVSVGPA